MSILPRIMSAHPEAPENFPVGQDGFPSAYLGLLGQARSRREMTRRRYRKSFAGTLKGL